MPYYLPDRESLQEIFGDYMAKGLQFELLPDPIFREYGLKVRFAKGSNAAPVFALPPEKMQTPEMARQWLEQLRDTDLALMTRGMP